MTSARREILNELFPLPVDTEADEENPSQDHNEVVDPTAGDDERTSVEPCTICFEPLDAQPCLETCCHHTFHRQCLLTWMADTDHDDCPTCRYAPLYDPAHYAESAKRLGHNSIVESTTTAQTVPTRGGGKWLVYWVFLALVIQLTITAVFIQNQNSGSSQATFDFSNENMTAGFEFGNENVTALCEEEILPSLVAVDETVRECIQDIADRPCAICGIFSPKQCLCFCRNELQAVSRARYSGNGKCCQCSGSG